MSWMFLETVAPCSACGRRRPLDQVSLSVTCFCGAPAIAVPANLWQLLLEHAPMIVPNLDAPQKFDILDALLGTWGPSAPCCSGCEAELLGIDETPPDADTLACPSCGLGHRLTPLPEEIEAATTRMLLAPKPEADLSLSASAEGNAFPCPQCGGQITVDGAQRTPTCPYCSASAYVPDQLWGRIQGTVLPTRWYMWVG